MVKKNSKTAALGNKVSNSIVKGDDVIVITGRDKGKVGKILSVVNKAKSKLVTVSGVNTKCHFIKQSANNIDQKMIEKREAAIDISNIKKYKK